MKRVMIMSLTLLLISPLFCQQINAGKKFIQSALIPGWGELSLQKNSGYAFLAAEMMMWSTVFYFNEELKLKDRGSINYAIKYAHIDPAGDYDADFYYHLSRYMSSGYETGGYNARVVEEAKAKYPNEPAAQSAYILANSYSDDFYWSWDSRSRRHDYSIMRKRITEYKGYIKGITGGIIANHIISAINTLLLANKMNRLELGMEFNANLNPTLTLSYKF